MFSHTKIDNRPHTKCPIPDNKRSQMVQWAKVKSKTQSFTIECHGNTHTIKLTKRGQLVLCNHTSKELKHEEVVIALDGAESRCRRVLRDWISGADYMLPEGLKAIRQACKSITSSRLALRETQGTDELKHPFAERLSTIFKLIVMLILPSVQEHGYGKILVTYRGRTFERVLDPTNDDALRLDISHNWADIYRLGLTLVEGSFVTTDLLSFLPADPYDGCEIAVNGVWIDQQSAKDYLTTNDYLWVIYKDSVWQIVRDMTLEEMAHPRWAATGQAVIDA